MKKLFSLGLMLFPSLCFADRLGGMHSGSDVPLSTQTVRNTDSLISPSTFYVTSGTVQGPLTINGGGNGLITGTIAPASGIVASTFTTLWTSGTYTVGQAAIFSSTNGTVVGGSSGGGNPGGSSLQIQYNNGGAFGGVPNSNVWASSVTMSTMSILVNTGQTANTGLNGTGGPGVLDVYVASPYTANRTLFAVGSGAQANQFYVPNNNQPVATLGIQAGQLIVGDTGASGQRIYSNGDPNSFIDLRNGSSMTLQSGTANGQGDIRIQPAGDLVATFTNPNGVYISSLTIISQELLPGATFSYGQTVSVGGVNGSVFLNAGNVTATGASNVILGGTGKTAGSNLTNGANNTCIGATTCQNIATDQSATALGTNALKVTSGTTNNTGIGSSALFSNTSGNGNTALGKNALVRNVTGSFNLALGESACDNAGFTSSTTLSGSICIGDSSYVDASHVISIGSTHNSQSALTDVYLNGRQSEPTIAGAPITFHAQSSSGTDVAGGNLAIAAGQGSGAGSGGEVYIQVSSASTSGATLNTLVTVATFSAASGVSFNNSLSVNGSINNAGLNGVYMSSGIYKTIVPVITGTSTITSTMSVVLASCTTRGAAPTDRITLTLPSASTYPGFETTIYNVGADSCTIKIAGAGTDLIESTGILRLDAQTQHASLHSLGNGLWGAGTGGIQYTPWSIFTTQDDVGTFTVATASDVYSCPIYIPIPVGFMGVRIGRSTNTGLIGTAITDMNGKYEIGVSSMITQTGMNNYFTGGIFQLSPGWHRAEIVIPNTTTVVNGSNSVNSSKAFCSKVGTSTTGSDLSGFVPTLPGTGDTRAYPAFDLLLTGGMQTF